MTSKAAKRADRKISMERQCAHDVAALPDGMNSMCMKCGKRWFRGTPITRRGGRR